MKHKKILMNFLTLGSAVILLLFVGCKKETLTSYFADVQWKYVNNSSYDIKIQDIQYNRSIVILKGTENDFKDDYGNSEEFPDNFFPIDIFDSCSIVIDEVSYKIDGEKFIRNKSNYLVEKNNPYFKFTYTFTDENIAELKE